MAWKLNYRHKGKALDNSREDKSKQEKDGSKINHHNGGIA